MDSFRLLDRRTGYIAAAIMLALTLVVSALASAAQVTERSIALSSASADADNVTYQVNFDAVTDGAEAFVVDFCSNSPLIGTACTPPGGFSASGAASSSSGVTAVAGSASKVVVTRPIDPGSVSVELTGINNPTAAGPLYARILTFASFAAADGYESEDPDAGGAPIDDGGVALYITPTIGVSGAVLESMTFCVSGQAPEENCTNTNPPVLALGETVGSTRALTNIVSSGSIFSQISTNAVGGAVVNLKSGVDCGGMKRFGASVCDIAPANTGNVLDGEAKVGVRLGTAVPVGLNANGTVVPADGSVFDTTNYRLPWTGNNTGVSSVYGTPLLDTDNNPVNNQNMEMTFGASISNSTPAGIYSADLSMIATGKF